MILPIAPFTKDGMVSTPRSSKTIAIDDLFEEAAPGTLFVAGNFPCSVCDRAGELGIICAPYLNREDFSIANAALTADAAIMVAMRETGSPIGLKRCLVSGFGRIGKLLALRLKGAGAEVVVSARRAFDLCWIEAMGFKALKTSEWEDRLSGYDLIFNTIPAGVFSREDAAAILSGEGAYIELASDPGGFIGEEGNLLGKKRIMALGLPGKFFPDRAAGIIYDTLFSIYDEMEVYK